MAIRKIVKINEDLCNGCGVCIPACVEGALQIVDGKARLIKEIYCDGLGACLGECPEGAITIEERDAPEFDEREVAKLTGHAPAKAHAHPHVHAKPQEAQPALPCGCPGSAVQTFVKTPAKARPADAPAESALAQWPVQLMLVPPTAPFLRGSDLLICADCVPFVVPDFHERYLRGRAVLVGCPKLDDLDLYRRKLAEIFATAEPASITVLRMEVPCCGGIAHAVLEARDASAPHLPVEVHTLGVRGGIQRQTVPGNVGQACNS